MVRLKGAGQDVKLRYEVCLQNWGNANLERFNRTVRYEWLSQYYRLSLEEVQEFATRWMCSYDNDRPNMALGGFTPKQKLTMSA
jgi:putative transposase